MDLVKINFIDKNGKLIPVSAPCGLSVLEVARESNIDLEGACDGSLACATCHVIVDKASFDKLSPASEQEEDMLDMAFGLTHTSRLGCQIIIEPHLEGATFALPTATRNVTLNKDIG